VGGEGQGPRGCGLAAGASIQRWILRAGLTLLFCAFLPATPALADSFSLSLDSGGGSAPYTDLAGVSADGTHAVIATTKQLDGSDTDASIDLYDHVGAANTLVSTGPAGGNGAFPASFAGISSDGQKFFFETS
jgi:hypothetical protein